MSALEKQSPTSSPPGMESKEHVAHLEKETMGIPHAHQPLGIIDEAHLFQEDSEGHVLARLLLPRPTNDPNDPLTWQLWRKYLATFSVCYFIFLSYYITSSFNPILVTVAIDLDVSVTKSSWLVTFNVLLLGIGNLFWIPLSRKIGKRPVILLCTAIFFASSLWAALAKSYGSLFGARLIQGFGASSSEVLAPAVVADLYFVHERGFWVGLCMFMISFGNSLGGIFGGLVANANPNWRWVFWMNVILTGTCFLTAILFAAETNYQRPLDNEGGEGMHPSELEAIRARANSTWVQSLNVTSWYDRETSIWWLWARPWLTLRLPAVPWASLIIGINLGAFVLIATANSALFPALYNYDSLQVGNIAIGYLIAAIFGALAGGPLSDWIANAITKRRGGYFRPEFRLWCLILPAIFIPVGVMMWGGGLQHHSSPFVAIVASAIFLATTSAIPATCIAYVVDCYRPLAGETITVLTSFKNTCAFALSFAVFPWLERSGPLKLSGYLLLIQGIVFLTVFPMYIYGHRLQKWSSKFVI